MSNETVYVVSVQLASDGQVMDLFITTGMEMTDTLQVEWDKSGEKKILPTLAAVETEINLFDKACFLGHKILVTVMEATPHQVNLLKEVTK